MSDRIAIQDVVTRMLVAVDRLEWEAIRGSLAENVAIDYTSLFGGTPETIKADELVNRWRGLLPGFDATQHMTGPIAVSLSGETDAIVETHVRGYHYIAGEAGGSWMVAGHYVMPLRKTASGWKIVGITLDTYWQEGKAELVALATQRASTRPRK